MSLAMPIKIKFGWPFVKLHGHKTEVLSTSPGSMPPSKINTLRCNLRPVLLTHTHIFSYFSYKFAYTAYMIYKQSVYCNDSYGTVLAISVTLSSTD